MNGLRYLTETPPNAAVPLSDLDGRPLPQHRVYQRNSFPMPGPGEVSGEIEVSLPGDEGRILTPASFAELDPVDMDIVLECAGNGRSLVRPAVAGLAWDLGGVSPIRIGGVRLIAALGGLPDEVTEVVLTGFDRGEVRPEGEVHYQFSAPAALVRDGSALLVTRMGGEPLGLEHGGPVRFVLPGHYAMRSVKWLTRIEGAVEPFTGHFVNRYRYFDDEVFEDGTSVAEIQVRSVIASPVDGDRLSIGSVAVEGSAWSGTGEVAQVEVSTDHGETWVGTVITPGSSPMAATAWQCVLEVGPGRHTVMARATDSNGNIQPVASRWNRNGYANNLVHTIGFEAS